MPAFIVAEIGVAWNGDRTRIASFIEAAAKAGADAVKFQAFNAEHLIARRRIAEGASLQNKWNVRDLLHRCQLSDIDLEIINATAIANKIKWFASVFDPSQVERVLRHGACALKVGHGENEYEELLAECENRHQQAGDFWISSSAEDIGRGCNVLCVCEYPATSKPQLHLINTPGLHRGDFRGFSSHYADWRIPAAAAMRDVDYIEAHFKLNDKDPEAPWSLSPEDFAKMVKQIREYESWL